MYYSVWTGLLHQAGRVGLRREVRVVRRIVHRVRAVGAVGPAGFSGSGAALAHAECFENVFGLVHPVAVVARDRVGAAVLVRRARCTATPTGVLTNYAKPVAVGAAVGRGSVSSRWRFNTQIISFESGRAGP